MINYTVFVTSGPFKPGGQAGFHTMVHKPSADNDTHTFPQIENT